MFRFAALVLLLTASAVSQTAVGPTPKPSSASWLGRSVRGGFAENHGQWAEPARFVWRNGGMTAVLEPSSIRVVRERRRGDEVEGAVVRLSFAGHAE